MTMPNHLFLSEVCGDLHDTRVANWSHVPPLRANYSRTFERIETAAQLKATLRAGEHTGLGGYPLFFVMGDGAPMSFASVRANVRECLGTFAHPNRFEPEWRPIACAVNWESALTCAHSGDDIPAAYPVESE